MPPSTGPARRRGGRCRAGLGRTWLPRAFCVVGVQDARRLAVGDGERSLLLLAVGVLALRNDLALGVLHEVRLVSLPGVCWAVPAQTSSLVPVFLVMVDVCGWPGFHVVI